MPTYDLLITGADVIDGTGGPRQRPAAGPIP